MANKTEKRECEICEKEFEVIHETIGRFGRRKGNGCINTYSNEGVPFPYHRYNVWFCNDCWKEIIKHMDVMKK